MDHEHLKDILSEDEHIRWMGRPLPFKLLDDENKKALILRWSLCALISIGLTLAYVYYCISSGTQFKSAILIFTAAVPLYLSLEPFIYHRRINRSAVYAITNKRAIVVSSSGRPQTLDLGAIDCVSLHEGENGAGTLRIGSAVQKLKPHKFRTATLFGRDVGTPDKPDRGILFYHAENLDEAQAMLTSLI